MSFRYIGSKARLVDVLAGHFGTPREEDGRFVDAFCGTGNVAEVAAKLGWPVWLNDHLVSAGVVASGRLISNNDVSFRKLGGYSEAIELLNTIPPRRGFIWKEYSPASINFIDIERRYFTEENAGRIDAIREQIAQWKNEGSLSRAEETLLIADLLGATNRVANIAGTYGCFLSKWTSQAKGHLLLKARELNKKRTEVKLTAIDTANIKVRPNDLVYLDPPYTKRQYASYYHVLETITFGDKPLVEGVSGLRPWRDKASDYCYKRKALKALTSLIDGLGAKRVLLSYSAEGHVPIEDLHNNLEKLGLVKTFPLMSVGRYRPNKVASSSSSSVREYLIVIEKKNLCDAFEEGLNECYEAI